MGRRAFAGLAFALFALSGCRAPQLSTSYYEMHWTPLEELDGEIVMRQVEARPRSGVRIESLIVEFRDADGAALERVEARPVPEDSFVSVGDLRASARELVSVVILLKHDRSPSTVRVELRP